jgi:hypothetical protein
MPIEFYLRIVRHPGPGLRCRQLRRQLNLGGYGIPSILRKFFCIKINADRAGCLKRWKKSPAEAL